MPKPPKELLNQIAIFSEVIESVNNIIDNKKIKVENYGKDFLEPLTKIRSKAMELRNDLELFKDYMERALTEQYYSSSRFAGEVNKQAAKSVVDKFLSSNIEF
jgi:hypothetical protein